MLSLIVSTIAFFVAAYYLKRYLENIGIAKGMTRNFTVFVLAAAISYAIAWLIDRIVP